MTATRPVAALLLPLLFALPVSAEPDAKLPPIKKLTDVKPKRSVFRVAKRGKPLVIRTTKEAAEHFAKDDLAQLTKQVDFKQQFVLLFAWRGSGGDRLKYDVAESFPEQVMFHLKPGRTRDLRSHIHVYVLRSNVKWKVK